MPILKTITLYQFDELSDAAKETARQWWRDAMDASDYAESVIEDAAEVARILGVEFDSREYKTVGGATRSEPAVYWSGFSCQGDGASFDGSYRYAPGSQKAIRAYAPQDKRLHAIADTLAAAQKRHFYKLRATCKQSGHYMHSGCMSVEVTHADDDCRDIGDSELDIRIILRGFADWIYRQLEKEYEYRTADQQVDETIEANEYTFTADGKRENA